MGKKKNFFLFSTYTVSVPCIVHVFTINSQGWPFIMPIMTINTLGMEQLIERNQKVKKRLDEVQKFHFIISRKNSTLRKFEAIHQGRVSTIVAHLLIFSVGR